jgi:hypothetical protein
VESSGCPGITCGHWYASHPPQTTCVSYLSIRLAVDEVPFKESQAFSFVFEAICKYPNEVGIQAGGLFALASLLEIDSYAASLLGLRGNAVFIVALVKKYFAYPAVVAHGFHCLRVIVT